MSSVRIDAARGGGSVKAKGLDRVGGNLSRDAVYSHAHDRWRTALVLAGKDSTVSEFEPVTSGGRRRQERRGKSDDTIKSSHTCYGNASAEVTTGCQMGLTLGLFRETPNVVKVSRTALRQMCSLRFSLALLLAAMNLGTTSAVAGSVERGEYIFKIAGCLACHTAKNDGAAELAGRHEFKTPYGTFYSPNITPDERTGIGAWTLDEFDAALRHGERPQGGSYYPVFPYTSYTKMRDGDVADLYAYLRSRKPVEQENREHELVAPFSWRWLNGPWKAMFFEPGSFRPRQDKSEAWNRVLTSPLR